MKKYSLLFSYLFLPFLSFTQNNQVGNPGFEDVEQGFNCPIQDKDEWSALKKYWHHCQPWTVPDLRVDIGCIFGRLGSPDLYCAGGHNSNHFVRCNFEEYIIHQIPQMEPGKLYYIEFYVKTGTSGPDGGLKLFENRPKQCGDENQPLKYDGTPDVAIPVGINIMNWTKVSKTYTADKEYKWFALGAFNANHHPNGNSYDFDDISIIEVGSSACPDVNYIQNLYFHDIGKITYKSQNLTIAGNSIASTIPQGNVVIGSTAIVEFKSATKVVLEPGFSVDEGAYFEAHIAPCDADCFPAIANAGIDAVSCGNQTIQLGSPSEENITYIWSSVPASALAYLSNYTISNPVFTPPASGNGRIVYTLKATNACGNSVTDNVTITYEANPNNSPTVSVSNINYSDLIEFDANFGSHTEQLIVEVWTTGGSSPIYTHIYTVGVDGFNCCTYHWKIPAGFAPCQDYIIKVKTKNYCSSVFSAVYTINWIRNTNLSIVIMPNYIDAGNGVPSWCPTFTGGTYYHLKIWDANGNLVYQNNGPITPPTACFWSGECNTGLCPQSTVTAGDHYYELIISGCGGSSINLVGDIFVMLRRREMNPTITDSTQNLIGANNLINSSEAGHSQIKAEIYPNPNNGSFTVAINGISEQKINTKIIIYDVMGNIVKTMEMVNDPIIIDISSQPKGMYFVKIENEQGIKVEKIIYQ